MLVNSFIISNVLMHNYFALNRNMKDYSNASGRDNKNSKKDFAFQIFWFS